MAPCVLIVGRRVAVGWFSNPGGAWDANVDENGHLRGEQESEYPSDQGWATERQLKAEQRRERELRKKPWLDTRLGSEPSHPWGGRRNKGWY